jgi:hypothetical protein
MSLVLNQVVQAQCPGCGNTLRIPANWIAEPMKCKHCGLVFQAKAPKPPKKKRNLIKNAIKGATRLAGKMKIKRRRKKKKDKGAVSPVVSKPVAPPPGVPVAAPALPGAQAAVPVAKVAGNGAITPAPMAMPAGKMVPTAAPVAVGLANGQKPPSFKRRGGSWAKLAFIFIFLLGVGSLAAVVHHLNPGLFSQGDDEEVADNGGDTKPAGETKPGDTKPTEPQGLFKTNSAPKKTESTRMIFNTAPVTRATQPKITYPVKPPIETRPIGTKPIQTRPVETRPLDRPTDTRDTRVTVPVVDAGKGYPRSLLAISINNYPYANPVGYGQGGRSFDNVARQFAEVMRIPQDRVTILSDRAPVPLPPTKSLVMDAFEQFLSTKASRAMDHVVVLFVGHGVEINGNAYLVPLLGEPGDDKTLIPLDWVYSKLAASPAQEKLLILDVCRFDKQRGEERGAVAKMSEAFEAALQKPPKGVEVMSACGAGEYSWEVERATIRDKLIEGGFFLNAVALIKEEGGLRGVEHKPDGPMPVEELFKAMKLRTSPLVSPYVKEPQTPKLFGARGDKMVAFDPKATVPGKISLKLNDADFPGGIAGANDLAGILDLPNKVPPIKQGDKGNQLRADSLPPYPKTPLAAYKSDNKDSDFRAAVRDGINLLVKHNNAFQETFPPLPANQQQKNQFFGQLTNQQMALALVYNDLESKYEELKLLSDDRKNETKLWQANYDYVMARIQFRMAYFYEYNAMLGKIRKEELPQLDPQVHKGYKLASKASMSDRDAQKIADNAKKILKKLSDDHKGTPWELIAKKEMFTSLGLEWVAY